MAEVTDLERAVLVELRRLPEDDQRDVLAYATFKRERRDHSSSGRVFRVEHGKLAEFWLTWDNTTILAQLGLLPDARG